MQTSWIFLATMVVAFSFMRSGGAWAYRLKTPFHKADRRRSMSLPRNFWKTSLLLFFLLSLVNCTALAPPSLQQQGAESGVKSSSSSNLLSERTTNSILSMDDVGDHGLLLGKDRELFHASIDLRKAWAKLVDKESWVNLFRGIVKALSQVSGADDSQMIFKEIGIEMLLDIRKRNPDANLKLFQGTIKQAETFARRHGRFLVVYIEENLSASAAAAGNRESRSIKASEQFRNAFADTQLGSILNEQFVFFAGSTAHAPTNNIAKLLGYTKKDLPLFAILTPAYVETPSVDKKRVLPEVVVTLRLSSFDIDSSKILRFLQRVLDVHGPILSARKREFDEILSRAPSVIT